MWLDVQRSRTSKMPCFLKASQPAMFGKPLWRLGAMFMLDIQTNVRTTQVQFSHPGNGAHKPKYRESTLELVELNLVIRTVWWNATTTLSGNFFRLFKANMLAWIQSLVCVALLKASTILWVLKGSSHHTLSLELAPPFQLSTLNYHHKRRECLQLHLLVPKWQQFPSKIECNKH